MLSGHVAPVQKPQLATVVAPVANEVVLSFILHSLFKRFFSARSPHGLGKSAFQRSGVERRAISGSQPIFDLLPRFQDAT